MARSRSMTLEQVPMLDLDEVAVRLVQQGKSREEKRVLLKGLVSPRRAADASSMIREKGPPRVVKEKEQNTGPKEHLSASGRKIQLRRNRSPRGAGGAGEEYTSIVWGMAKRSSDGGAGLPRRSSFSGSRRTSLGLPRSPKGAPSLPSAMESTTSNSSEGQNITPRSARDHVPLREGAFVIIFELEYGGSRRTMFGYSGGRAGPLRKSDIKMLPPDQDMVAGPVGDNPRDWQALVEKGFPVDNYAVLKDVLASVPSTERNELAKAVVEMFRLPNSDPLPLLRHFIKEELVSSSKHTVFFRGNSLRSKVLSEFTRAVGDAYLRGLVTPLLRMLKFTSDEDIGHFEKPPVVGGGQESEEAAGKRSERNAKAAKVLWQNVDFVLALVTESWLALPVLLRQTGHIIYAMTNVKFESTVGILGGFLLLRFVSPALSAPEAHGFDVTGLSAAQRQHMLNISKCLQAISNEQPFSSAGGMDCMNEYLPEASARLSAFFKRFEDPIAVSEPSVTRDSYHVEDASQLNAELMMYMWRKSINALPKLASAASMMRADAVESVRLTSLLEVITGMTLQ